MGNPTQTAEAGQQAPEEFDDSVAAAASTAPDEATAADLSTAAQEDWVVAEHGACPMCQAEFDDPAEFRDHLGAAHGLYDDDGTETGFGEFAVLVRVPRPVPAINAFAPPQRSYEAPSLGRPLGLAALVILLVGVLGALVAFTGRGSDDDMEAGDVVEPYVKPDGRGAIGAGAQPTSPDGPSTGGEASSADVKDGTAVEPGQVTSPSNPASPGSGPAEGTGESSTPAPDRTTTTVRSSQFSSPTTEGARIDSCSRVRNELRLTYSWTFAEGAGWTPLAAYTSMGGNRYQHTIVVKRGKAVAISWVYVADSTDATHAVALDPSLSTATC
jgi:hypothetical protein